MHLIVHLVKRARSRPLTAAIGDGGNDVSMIQEAHVGLGITGKEGRQAAMSADFAFAKFMYLERVLLVHGHWYYLRVAVLVQYFFYKNVVFITPQLLFNVYGNFSGQALYDKMFLILFNIIFTSVPILVYGVYEQNYSDRTLSNYPTLYQLNSRNNLLSCSQFTLWTLIATWQMCAIYFLPFYCYEFDRDVMFDTESMEHWSFGTCIFVLVTLVVNLQILLLSSYWTVTFILSIFLSELAFFATTSVYTWIDLRNDGHMLDVFFKLVLSYKFLFLTLLVLVVCLIPTLFIVIYKNRKPNTLRNKLESREENISGVIYSPIEPASPTIPNRRSSTIVPWRGNFSFYDNKAF